MIEVRHLTKSFVTKKGRKYVFRDLSFVIPPQRSAAILGRNGTGKSTFIRLLSGQDTPDAGEIRRQGRLSFPVGLTGGFQGSMTGRQNAKFVARVHGANAAQTRSIVDFTRDFAELGDYFDLPVNTYSSGMRSRLAFGLSLAFNFDYYLIDEAISVGDATFRKKATQYLMKRIAKANVILVTHDMAHARRMCDMVIHLRQDGEVALFDDVEAGIKAYSQA